EQADVRRDVVDDENPGRFAHGHDSSLGRAKTNRLPCPGSLSTQMRPPCNSTRRLESARPRPVPSPCCTPTSVCWNSSKILSWSAGAMPGPVSVTDTYTSPAAHAVVMVTLPLAGV